MPRRSTSASAQPLHGWYFLGTLRLVKAPKLKLFTVEQCWQLFNYHLKHDFTLLPPWTSVNHCSNVAYILTSNLSSCSKQGHHTKPFALPFWNDSTHEWDLYNHVFCCVKLFHSWPCLSWVDCNNNCAPILPAPVTFLIYLLWYAGGYSPNKWFLQAMRQKKWNPETHIHRWSDTTTNPLFILVCILLMLQLKSTKSTSDSRNQHQKGIINFVTSILSC